VNYPFKQPCRKTHSIIAVFQDDNVKIYLAQIVKEWMGRSRILFTHELATLSPDLKFFGNRWDVLEMSRLYKVFEIAIQDID